MPTHAHAQRPSGDEPPPPVGDDLDAWYRAAIAETMRPCREYHQPVEPAALRPAGRRADTRTRRLPS